MDIKTILICLFIVNIFLGVFTYAIKKTQTTFPGINFWILSNLLIGLGYFLMSQRSLIPDFFTIIIAQNLFTKAGIIRIFGLNRFFNKKNNFWQKLLSGITVIFFLMLIIVFTYMNDSIYARTIVSGLFLSGISIITGIQILKNRTAKNQFNYIFTASAFFIFSMIFLSRITGWILFPEIRNLFTSTIINDVQFMSSLVIDITWTSMFFVLQNQRLNDELSGSEKKYRSIFTNSFSGVLLVDKNGNYLDTNPSFYEITGYSKSEMIEKPIGIITHTDDLEKVRSALQKLLSGSIQNFNDQIRLIHKNGSTKWVQLNANVNIKPNDEFEYILVEILDITAQKDAEQEIFRAKENAVLKQKKIIYQKEEIELQNERLESLLRITQFQTNSIQELLDFALNEAIELTNSKIGYIYFYNEETKQFILNTWSKDVMKECAVANPQTVYDLDATGCWGEAVRQRKPIVLNDYQAENLLKKGTPEGHVKLTKFLTIPVIIDDKIVAVAGVANKTDDYDTSDIRQLTLLMDNVWKISERITFIDKLNNAKEKAELSEKELSELNATKDKLFSIIAHDLRSPFNSILGFAKMLSKDIGKQSLEKSEKIIEFINLSAQSTLNLLNNLLDWAKYQTGHFRFNPQFLNLSEILQAIINEQSFVAKLKNVTLNCSETNEMNVFADQNMLETILRNLISNAIKYSYLNGEINISAVKHENDILITITDNGTGMSKETRNNLFMIGEQESLEGTSGEKGTGLGLLLCKDFIEKHGGKIWVESEQEKGSRFHFTIPNKS